MKRGLSWVLSSLLALPLVFAQENGLGIINSLYSVFGFLGDISFTNPTAQTVFFAKLLVWIIIFAALFYGLRLAFNQPETKKFATIIAAAMSVGAIIAMPPSFVLDLFRLYGVISIVLLVAGPLVGVFFITRAIKNTSYGSEHPRFAHVLQAAMYALVLIGLKTIDKSLKLTDIVALNYTTYLTFSFGMCEIFMFYHILAVFFSGGKESIAAMNVGESVGNVGESITPGFKKAAKRIFRKNYRYEKRIVKDLEKIKKDVMATPIRIKDATKKLKDADSKVKGMIVLSKYANDLGNRIEKVADVASKQRLEQQTEVFKDQIETLVPEMINEIKNLTDIFGRLHMPIPVAGITFLVKKIDDLMAKGRIIEQAIIDLELKEEEIEKVLESK